MNNSNIRKNSTTPRSLSSKKSPTTNFKELNLYKLEKFTQCTQRKSSNLNHSSSKSLATNISSEPNPQKPRFDVFGNKILKGNKLHRISFADKIHKKRKLSEILGEKQKSSEYHCSCLIF